MRHLKPLLIAVFIGLIASSTSARDRIRLDTTVIKGNKEMPQIVYIIPWKDMKNQDQKEQTLVLHSLFGNLFDPVHASDVRAHVRKPAKLSVSRY